MVTRSFLRVQIPKAQKDTDDLTKCQRFCDLHVQKLLIKCWWNWLQVEKPLQVIALDPDADITSLDANIPLIQSRQVESKSCHIIKKTVKQARLGVNFISVLRAAFA